MILLADAGGSKTRWVWLNPHKEEVVREFLSEGINPSFTTAEQIDKILTEAGEAGPAPEAIHYYGAGIHSPKSKELMRSSIEKQWKVPPVTLDSDIVGAAKSVAGNRPGIVCILGTGSNAVYWDGLKVVKQATSLGFTLGDEGSGGWLGKQLLRNWFYGLFPDELKPAFEDIAPTYDQLLENLYRNQAPNKWVASFTPFLGQNLKHPWCRQLVMGGFKAFSERILQMVVPGDFPAELTIGATGSVAASFSALFEEVMQEQGFNIGRITSDPMEGLIKYHLQSK